MAPGFWPSGFSFPFRNILRPKRLVGALVKDKVNFMFSNLLILGQGLVVLCLKRKYILNYSQERSLNFVVEGKFCCGGEFCEGKVSFDNDFTVEN